MDAPERGNPRKKISHQHLLWWTNKLKWRMLHNWEITTRVFMTTPRFKSHIPNTGGMLENMPFSFDLCSTCGLDNSWTASSTCDVNLQLPTSLQVLNVAAYSCRELLDTRCVCLLLWGTVKCLHSSMQYRVHSFLVGTLPHRVHTVGSLTSPPARNDSFRT